MSIKPATTYYYRVKAVSTAGESDYSNVISVTTNSSNDFVVEKQNPSIPVLNKTIISANSVLLHIQKPALNEYVEEYKVTVSTTSDFSSLKYDNLTYLLDVNTSNSTSNDSDTIVLNIADLLPNTQYYFKVSAVNSESSSGFLTFNLNTTTALDSPTLLGASNITDSEFRVQWTKVDNATGYRLDVSPNSTFTSNVVNDLDVGDVLFKDVIGLTPNTPFFIRVRAYNGSIVSPNSPAVQISTLTSGTFTNLGKNIPSFSILGIFDIDSDSFLITWEKRTEANFYSLDISTNSDFSNFVIENFETTKTSYKATGLTPNTTYYIRVKAVNSFTETNYVSFTVTTLANNTSLNPPIASSSSNVKSSSFEAQWVKRNYASRYKLQLSTSSAFASILEEVIVGNVDFYVFDSLLPNTTYHWRVAALNSLNISNFSNAIFVTTSTALPNITNLVASYTSGLNISWTGNTVYTKYYLTVYKSDGTGYLAEGLFRLFDVGNSTSFKIESFLEEDTLYSVYVTGETSNGDKKISNTIDVYIPASSPRLTVSNDSKLLSWSKKLNRLEAAYDKDFKFRIPGWVSREVPLETNSLNIEELSKLDKNIYFRGYFFSNSTKGNYSNTAELFSSTLRFKPLTVTKSSADISWFSNSNSYKYQLLKKVDADWVVEPGYTRPITTNISSVELEDLTANTEYKLTVQYLENNSYLDSLPLLFKTNLVDSVSELPTEDTLPLPNASISNISFDQVTVNLPNTYSYYLLELSDRSDFIYILRYIEATTSFILPVKKDKDYYLKVYGVNGSSKTEPQLLSFKSEDILDTPLQITTAPVLSNLVEINSQEASIQWTVPTNSENFKIEISQSSNFTYLEKDIFITRTGSNKAILSGFYSSNTYYIRMYAFNGYSISPYSNVLLLDLT